MAATKNTEYIKVKVFLYKYTPKFNTIPNLTNKNAEQAVAINNLIISKQKELDDTFDSFINGPKKLLIRSKAAPIKKNK